MGRRPAHAAAAAAAAAQFLDPDPGGDAAGLAGSLRRLVTAAGVGAGRGKRVGEVRVGVACGG
jgi:hypothetical protein